LAGLLRKPGADLSGAGLFYDRRYSNLLAPADVSRALSLYRAVQKRRGPGSQQTLMGLLDALVSTGDPGLLPFWREALTSTQKRDRMKSIRPEFVVAAFAIAAYRADEGDALALLVELAARGETPTLRALAARALWLAPATIEGAALSAEVRSLLSQIAVEDAALLPRHQARRGLRHLEAPCPLDAPEGAMRFDVRLGRASSCAITLPSTAPLTALHHSIQAALDWDDDHLYSFFLDGVVWSRAFEIPGRTPLGHRVAPADQPDAGDWRVGEVGFKKGCRFVYFFDFGDRHRFDVKVCAIHEVAPAGGCLGVECSGDPPAQYHRKD